MCGSNFCYGINVFSCVHVILGVKRPLNKIITTIVAVPEQRDYLHTYIHTTPVYIYMVIHLLVVWEELFMKGINLQHTLLINCTEVWSKAALKLFRLITKEGFKILKLFINTFSLFSLFAIFMYNFVILKFYYYHHHHHNYSIKHWFTFHCYS